MVNVLNNEVPALAQYGGQYYAVAFRSRLRWRVKRLDYDWSVYTTRGQIPGWGFQAIPVRYRGITHADAQQRMTNAYRQLVDDAMKGSEDSFRRMYAQDWSPVIEAERKLMRDWPDSQIDTPAWTRELERRKRGEQPSLFSRLWTEDEVVARGPVRKYDWVTK